VEVLVLIEPQFVAVIANELVLLVAFNLPEQL
jgi:hypothetical protein